jgi:hypothetical protein
MLRDVVAVGVIPFEFQHSLSVRQLYIQRQTEGVKYACY